MHASHNISIRAAAERFGVHENTIRNWINRGILAAQRLPSGVRRVKLVEVERLEAEMLGVPTSFPEVEVRRAPKPRTDLDEMRPSNYPEI